LTDIVRVADEYYVRASSALADDRTRVLKSGDTFLIANRYGDIEALGTSQFGLFHAESRHLSSFSMRLNRLQPLLLSSVVREDNAFLAVDLTNVDSPQSATASIGDLSRGTVHVFRSQFLLPGCRYEHIRLRNYGLESIKLVLSFGFGADFADIFEVRGSKRERHGTHLSPRVEGDAVVLAYQGLDGLLRQTHIAFSPRPTALSANEAFFSITLAPAQETSTFCSVSCVRGNSVECSVSYETAFSTAQNNIKQAEEIGCHVGSSSETFDLWLKRSSADLLMLTLNNPEGPYPYAGVPWFSTVFGRDGIITALQCLWTQPHMAESVLKYLAQTQATEAKPDQDAEPGKILHEMRRGEMAATHEVPFGRYYGSIDSTPLFVMLAAEYYQRTGDAELIREIWPNIKRALNWIDDFGDRDGDGFIEYQRQTDTGLAQQGWKDSQDSVFHADGRLADPPIALCEVQSYVYAAKRGAAMLARVRQESELAKNLDESADTLQVRFNEAFWCEEIGSYAIALDGKKKQCRVRTSNAGHALYSGIAKPDYARRIVETLLESNSYCGWGVRTVAANEARYNPMSYHNGSVWPHDNSIVGMGLSRYGFRAGVTRIVDGLHEASCHVEMNRLPELFCGFHRRPETSGPTLYPVACAPQAWAAGSVFMLVQACLGLSIDAPAKRIRFTKSTLPSNVDEIQVHRLRIGDAQIDFAARRFGEDVRIEILRKSGSLDVEEDRTA
jgi:glycogen debranching enzyme